MRYRACIHLRWMCPAESNPRLERRVTRKRGDSSKRFDASMSPCLVNHEYKRSLWKVWRPIRSRNFDVSAGGTGNRISGGTGRSGVSEEIDLSLSPLLRPAHAPLPRGTAVGDV